MKTIIPETHIFGSDDRPVFRIIIYSFSLAFSALIVSSEMLRPTTTGFAFQLSWRTLLAFVISGAFFVPCFKAVFLSPSRQRRIAALTSVVVIGLASFLYPLRFVPADKFGEIFTGLGIAAGFLSTIGGILFAISRFLNADERRAELAEPASPVECGRVPKEMPA